MKGQKEYVVDKVLELIPHFIKFQHNAILMLSNPQLEVIKGCVSGGILNGTIEYSKDRNNDAEVRSYARSMVMNHLKKAKELNGGRNVNSGGNNSSTGVVRTSRANSTKLAPKGVNPDLLPEELKEYVKTLV